MTPKNNLEIDEEREDTVEEPTEEEIVFEEVEQSEDESTEKLNESIKQFSQQFSEQFGEESKGAESNPDDAAALEARRRRTDHSAKAWIQSELSELSGLASSVAEQQTDNGIIARTLADVGSHGYGILGVSVWIFDDGSDKLVPSGWWHNPSMKKSKALSQLINPSRADYVPEEPVLPGADLAGILWNESSGYDMAGEGRQERGSWADLRGSRRGSTGRGSISRGSTATPTTNRRASSAAMSMGSKSSTFLRRMSTRVSSNFMRSSVNSSPSKARRRSSVSQLLFPSAGGAGDAVELLQWRDIKSLVDDPDTAKGPRLALMEKAGFEQASGVTFQNDICQGIVIYYKASGLDQGILNSLANTSYLKQSSQMIGSCASMVKTRRATVGFTVKMRQSQQIAVGKNDALQKDKKEETKEHCSLVPQRIKKLKNKVQGGGMQIPPAPNFNHATWTTVGAFCALLLMSALNQYYKYLSNDELFLILGPYGALFTLQYGLTAAPASQPRNAMFGQALAGAVALVFTYIPTSIVAMWIRVALAPALAIGLMVKCGVTHPPAGAHAVLLASGKYNWGLYGIGLLSTFIAIVPATLINNLCDKRQYPTYWFVIPKWQKTLFAKTKQLVASKKKPKASPKTPEKSPDLSSSEEEQV